MQIPAFPVLPLRDLNTIETAPAPEPPICIMALHAMLYCERLFYLEKWRKFASPMPTSTPVGGCMMTLCRTMMSRPRNVRFKSKVNPGGCPVESVREFDSSRLCPILNSASN